MTAYHPLRNFGSEFSMTGIDPKETCEEGRSTDLLLGTPIGLGSKKLENPISTGYPVFGVLSLGIVTSLKEERENSAL